MNLRKLIDIIDYIENQEKSALLIMIDFHKFFDTIEFQAIEGALGYFNFGELFIKMIMLLYKKFQTVIVHNSYSS